MNARLVRFALVGTSGIGVNLAFVWLGLRLFGALGEDWREAAASALGIAASVGTNFVLHDRWTWGDREKADGAWPARLARFVGVSAAAAGLQFGVALAGRALVGADVYLAQVAGVGVGAAVNFAANHLWTFREAPR